MKTKATSYRNTLEQMLQEKEQYQRLVFFSNFIPRVSFFVLGNPWVAVVLWILMNEVSKITKLTKETLQKKILLLK